MNYQIIKDEKLFREFINWLPDLKPNEVFYFCLFSRAKYCATIDKKNAYNLQLKRGTATKQWLFEKVKQLECVFGAYAQKGGEPIPQETLALYINPNPRDLEKAARNSLKTLSELITKKYDGYNPQYEVLSQIQNSVGTKKYMNLDYDHVDAETAKIKINEIIPANAYNILKTRGGFHLLIETVKIDSKINKNWYQQLTKLEGCDVKGDSLMPVPGCTQGGFTPHFLV